MIGKTIILAAVAAAVAFANVAEARSQIRVVGSSTVFPFSTAVADAFGKATLFKTPDVESTGSGGGMKLFCAGIGENYPDITNASRRIKKSEFETCTENGIGLTEVKIGFDGIVIANSKDAPRLNLTKGQVFLALARQVPMNGKLVGNPYQTWRDIDASLPDTRIEVLGPPPTSGTRDAFVELVMDPGCEEIEGAKDVGLEGEACQVLREDGAYIEAGENDKLIVQKLETNPTAVGIFGFSFLYQNADRIQGARIEGVDPEFELIASGEYGISRLLYFYIKKQHVGVIPGIKEYVAEFTSERAWGPEGYLVEKGLIPLPAAERERSAENARILKPLSM